MTGTRRTRRRSAGSTRTCPTTAFRAGRTQVLKALLELPSIYRLAPLRDAWEETGPGEPDERELGVLGGAEPAQP